MATDQRYCLQCGQELGGNRDELLAAVGLGDDVRARADGLRGNAEAVAAALPPGAEAPDGGAQAPQRGSLRQLSPGLVTMVVGFMLATGIAVGAGTGGQAPAPAYASAATQQAQARAALLAVLAARRQAAAAAATTPAAVSTPKDAAPAPVAPVATTPAVAPPVVDSTPVATTPAEADTSTTPSSDATATTPTTPDTTTALPNITNVWVLSLPTTSINALNASTSTATNYLRDTIVPQGVLLSGYSLLDKASPVNAIAAVSGQPANAATSAGCTTRAEVPAGSLDSKTGIVTGDGCLFPAGVNTIASQLTAKGDAVRAYDQTAGAGCSASGVAPDPRAPLPYFDAFSSDPNCATAVGDQTALTADVATTATPPVLSWITAPDDPGAAIEFTATTLAAIEASPAYTSGGLILVLPESPSTAKPTDLAVGAVAISPFIPATTTNAADFGPYGVLRLLEDVFTLPALAGAGAEDVPQVDRSIFQTTASGARVHHQPTRSSS